MTKRRLLRFSVRTLLIVLTIGCFALGWKVELARKQREAVGWVREMGGRATYSYELRRALPANPLASAEPPGPSG